MNLSQVAIFRYSAFSGDMQKHPISSNRPITNPDPNRSLGEDQLEQYAKIAELSQELSSRCTNAGNHGRVTSRSDIEKNKQLLEFGDVMQKIADQEELALSYNLVFDVEKSLNEGTDFYSSGSDREPTTSHLFKSSILDGPGPKSIGHERANMRRFR